MKTDLIVFVNNRILYFKNGFIHEEINMSKQYTVREFIQLTPFAKVRLQESDPEQYNKLKKLADEQFNPNSDPEAAAELLKKG